LDRADHPPPSRRQLHSGTTPDLMEGTRHMPKRMRTPSIIFSFVVVGSLSLHGLAYAHPALQSSDAAELQLAAHDAVDGVEAPEPAGKAAIDGVEAPEPAGKDAVDGVEAPEPAGKDAIDGVEAPEPAGKDAVDGVEAPEPIG